MTKQTETGRVDVEDLVIRFKSKQGEMTALDRTQLTLWQDVDIGLKLDTDLAELLVEEAAWILDQGVVRGEPVSIDDMLTHFAPAALQKANPDAVSLP